MVDRPENDPRVEIAINAWTEPLPEGLSGLGGRVRHLLAAIDATLRPPPGEIVVTPELFNAISKRLRNAGIGGPRGEIMAQAIIDDFRELSALDPRNRAVEPVAGDAVEAAMKIMHPGYDVMPIKTQKDGLERMSRAISAADRARGRAYVTWRRPEEFVRTSGAEPSRAIWVVVNGGIGHEDYRDIREHSSEFGFSGTVLAWAEKAQMPEWATVARAATSERAARKATVHQTVPVQVWADIDIGIADFVRHLNRIPGVRTHSCCQGTIGEEGAEPYKAYVGVGWWTDDARKALEQFGLIVEGDAHGTVYPPDDRRLARQERIDAEVKACTECGSWGFPRRSDCESCTAVVDAEIASETPGAAVLAGSETNELVSCLKELLEQVEGCATNHYGDNPEGGSFPHIERARAAISKAETWKCGARNQGYTGGDYPAECNWPLCSCDPYANKVIAALDECGAIAPPAPIPAQPSLADAPEAPPVAWTAATAHALNMVLCQMRDDAIRGHRRDEAKNIEDARVAAFPSVAPVWPPADCYRLTKTAESRPLRCELDHVCFTSGCPHAKRGETGNG